MRQPPPRPTPFPYTTLFRSLDLLRSEVCIEQVERANRSERPDRSAQPGAGPFLAAEDVFRPGRDPGQRSEEHTSELQSLRHLVCRLLLEKKKKNKTSEQTTQ